MNHDDARMLKIYISDLIVITLSWQQIEKKKKIALRAYAELVVGSNLTIFMLISPLPRGVSFTDRTTHC